MSTLRAPGPVLVLALGLAGACAPPEGVAPETERVAPAAAARRIETPSGPFVRVLGTAQDGGFSHAACSGPHCRRARAEAAHERLVASLAIVLPASGRVYLIDATPDIRRQLDRLDDVRRPPTDRVDRAPVDGVFLTHAHIGHYLGLAFFGFEAVHTRELPVWATADMAAFLRGNAPWEQLVRLENIRLVEIDDGDAIDLGEGVVVEAMRVPHRDEYTDTVGYRIRGPGRTVLYIPDTDPWSRWPESLLDRLDGVDTALLDGAFYSIDELPGRSVEEIRHPLVGQTMDLLQELVEAGLEVHFTHLNHSNPLLGPPGEPLAEVERRGFAILADGQELPL